MNLQKLILKFKKSGYTSLTDDERGFMKANLGLLSPAQKTQFEKDETSAADDSDDDNDDDDSDDDDDDDDDGAGDGDGAKDDDKNEEAVDEKAMRELIQKSIKNEIPEAMEAAIERASDALVGNFVKGLKNQRKRGLDKNKKETPEARESTYLFIKAMQNKDIDALKEMHKISHKATTANETLTDPKGGYLVPEELRAEILRVAEAGYGLARREFMYLPFTGPGNERKIPTLASGFDAEWVDEKGVKASGNPTFGIVTQTLKKLAKIVPFTEEILEDSAINLTQLIATLFAESVAKQEDLAFFMGTGSPWTGILNNGDVNSVSMGALETIADLDADDLLDLQDATPAGALPGAKYYLHRHALSIVRKLKDDNGQYIWQKPTDGAPGTIWGFPYELSEALPDNTLTGVDKPFILFGNLKTAAIFGDKQQIRTKLLTEATITDGDGVTTLNLATQDMLALRMEERVGFVLALPDAVTVLKTGSAS